MTKSLENIRSVMAELKQRCDHLDYSVESPFISGSYNINPLNYYIGLISDIFSYFHQYLCTLKYFAELLSPEDTVAIEDYMSAIKSDKNYENLKENLHSYECL